MAEHDTELICALINLYKKVYRIIGSVVLVLGIALLPLLPQLINGSTPPDINLYVLYLIYLGNSVVSYWMFAYKASVLNVCQRNDVISKVSIITNILMYGTQIVLLLLIKNYYFYAIAIPLFSVFKNILTSLFATKLYPEYYGRGAVSKELKNDISKRVTGLMMNKIAFASRNAFDSVVISTILGLQSVAVYNNYYYVLSAVSGVMTAVVAAILPSIGNSIATETVKKNEADMMCISFAYMCVSAVCYCMFLNLYQPFMKLWVGEDLCFPTHTMMAFSAYFLVEKSENVLGNYYDAAGLWWHGKWKGFLEAATNLCLNIILCRFFGVLGIVIATLVSMLLVGIPLTAYYLYKYYYKKNVTAYYIAHYATLLKFIVIGLATYWLGMIIPEGATTLSIVLSMIGKAALAFMAFAVLFFLFFSRTEQYRNTKKWCMDHFRIRKQKT